MRKKWKPRLCLLTFSKTILCFQKQKRTFLKILNKRFSFKTQNTFTKTKYKTLFKKKNTTYFLNNYSHLLIGIFWKTCAYFFKCEDWSITSKKIKIERDGRTDTLFFLLFIIKKVSFHTWKKKTSVACVVFVSMKAQNTFLKAYQTIFLNGPHRFQM